MFDRLYNNSMGDARQARGGAVLPELQPLLRWLAVVESVLTGRSLLTYRDRDTNIPYVCAPTRLFEYDGELWVLGTDPGCHLTTGAPLSRCAVSEMSPRRKGQPRAIHVVDVDNTAADRPIVVELPTGERFATAEDVDNLRRHGIIEVDS